jgi:hypothetical protein
MLIITQAGEVMRSDEPGDTATAVGMVLEPGDDLRYLPEVARALCDEDRLCDPWSYRSMIPGICALREFVYNKTYKEPYKEPAKGGA